MPSTAPPPVAATGRRLCLAGALLALVPLLGGCGSADPLEPRLRTILYIAVAVEKASDLNAELEQQKQLRADLRQLETSFQEVQPGVHLELTIFDTEQFVPEIERRTHSGLAPDLMLVDGSTAERLHQRRLSLPILHVEQASALLRPELIPYVKAGPREWFAMPVGLQPQLACFDRRRMGRAPQTLAALMEASSRGSSLGLNLDLGNLAWTMGSLGTLRSIARVSRGAPADAGELGAIRQWLSWLRNADLQQRIRLVRSQGELVGGLRNGRFDWIPCHSRDAALLRLSLGSHLGLAPLPSGPGGPATPISTVRVWAFGRNSSHNQQRTARALVRFSLNPPVQRAFTILTQGMLPVNRTATLPVASSANLAALLAAQQQASDAQELTQPLIELRSERRQLNRIMTRFLYGEIDPPQAALALAAALERRPQERTP